MALNLKTYETQAKLSIAAAAIGALAALGAAAMTLQAFDWETFWTVYNPKGKRVIALGAALGVALLCGAIGFIAGFNSAGQKRNKQPQLSWTGFFMSAVTLTIALSVAVFFMFTRHGVVPK